MKNGQEQKRAAALQYDAGTDRAPIVTAKGNGLIAERIIELAVQKGIPVRSDPALVQVLMKLDMGEAIPVELYQAVAEVLAFVYQMNEKRGQASSAR
jgi:flagellar biosynthesis protein